jgi:hypothetical protein
MRDESFDLKVEFKNVFRIHQGPDRAITAGQLARMFGYKDDRIIRLTIRELIKGAGDGNRGLPVASATVKVLQPSGKVKRQPGYFIPTDRQQAEEYANSIKRRLIEDALRRRDFRNAADQWLSSTPQGRLV